MNAIDLLESQHRTVESLFEDYESGDGWEAKQAAFEKLVDTFAAHATIEERIFYPAAYIGDLKELLEEAAEEHLSCKRILADLLRLGVNADSFDAKMKVLKEQIEHHVEEEETELFKKVRKSLADSELETLGAQMESLFMEEMSGQPRAHIQNELGEAAALS